MAKYAVYLEIDEDGKCMAHVPDLPGCIVRAPTQDDALRRLPDAIREYRAWLHRHDETAPPENEPIEFQIAGMSTGFGPFDPGDAAAFFLPDQVPLSIEEMEHHFRLMAHTRADLIALVGDLPDDVFDWQAAPTTFSILRILRHIGNAEEWYVSRIVPPASLPREWERDKDMLIFQFLEMERRTALVCLRGLTDEQRAGIFHPSHYTQHPEEPWTARKVMRRFLEHEREHTAQIREILAACHC